MEDCKRPGTGDTTPPRKSRDCFEGRGHQGGGGVVRGIAEEGQNLEGSTHKGRQGP